MKNKNAAKYKALWNVMRREGKRLVSRPLYLFCMVGAPLFCYIFFTTLMGSGLPTDMPVGIVDEDMTSTSRQLTRNLDAFGQTAVVAHYPNVTEARQAMQRGDIYGFYYIPQGTTAKAQAQRQPKVSFYTNNTLLIAGSLLYKDMKTMSELASGAAARSVLYAKGATEDQAMGFLQPIVIDTHPLNNPWINYSVYLNNTFAPGVLMLLIFMVTVFSIGVEIKDRTARQWLRTGNNSIWISLAGKLLPHTVVFFLMGILYNVYLYGFLHFPCNSGILPMLFATLCLVLASQGMGVLMIDALRHPVPRAGLAGHGCADDRRATYAAPGAELRFAMGRAVVLDVRPVVPGHGHAPHTAGAGQPLPAAPLLPDLRGPGAERVSDDLFMDQLRGPAAVHDAAVLHRPPAEGSPHLL